jgi:hypothetical protein
MLFMFVNLFAGKYLFMLENIWFVAREHLREADSQIGGSGKIINSRCFGL